MNRDRPSTAYPVGSAPAPAWQASPPLAIVVDVPDVLYDATLWRRWLLRLVCHMSLPGDPAAFLQDWDASYLPDVHCGRREATEALQSFLLAAGFSWAQIDEIEAASRVQREALEHNPRALPGVVNVLARLAQSGVPLLAWCDATHSAAKVAALLDRLGLAGRFQFVLTSFDIEHAQPAAECYAAMLDRLALPAADVVYVGHEKAHLAGAKAAGMRTVAFNFHEPTAADIHLNRFEDLLSLVQPPACLAHAALAGQSHGRRGASDSPLSLEGSP
jgi:HAD superfamily hydrolase (TIGR01509 family)